jgi:undecaprenyl-diphosphatase
MVLLSSVVEIVKAIVLGIVEGVTEWLPISSTGHMILVDEFLKLDLSTEFKDMFLVVIQLGAILAVVVMFWNKLWPFTGKKTPAQKNSTLNLWVKIILACIPAAVVGIPLNDKIEELFYHNQTSSALTVAGALIFYGILFIVIENANKKKKPAIDTLPKLNLKTALYIGLFQLLSLIPGTSRSGATIIGAMLVGTSRTVAAEFTFFLSVPVMFGASFIKLLKFGLHFTPLEAGVLLTGVLVAFLVSMAAIRFLMNYVKKHDFKVFGWYRIALGLIVIAYFLLIK